MEHHKISKLLTYSVGSKLLTRKWNELYCLSGIQYSIKKDIRFRNSILRSDLYESSDAYIFVKVRITVIRTVDAKERNNETY